MAVERTLCLIKPDATARGLEDSILARIEGEGLRVVARRRLRLTLAQAQAFYAVHRERPFFESLCAFMASGEIVAQVLEGAGAVARYRALMGATDPAQAEAGTLRREFAESVERNAVHGSDSAQTAAEEIRFFFPALPA